MSPSDPTTLKRASRNMDLRDIIERNVCVAGGVELHMADGSVWFHPYNAGRPVVLRQPMRVYGPRLPRHLRRTT